METVFPEILLPIKNELDLVDNNVNQEMILKAGHVYDFTSLELHSRDRYLHPAVLILSAHMFGYNTPQVITMASVVQFIHIATGIHYGRYDKRPGLPVLIGDYFYAKFFSYLCKGEALEWLPEMAQVICDAHDAGVREVEQNQSMLLDLNTYTDLLKKQSSLLGVCSTFGVLATKGDVRYEKALRTFGLNLGATLNLINNNRYRSLANELLSEAVLELRILPDGPEKKAFESLLDACHKSLHEGYLVG